MRHVRPHRMFGLCYAVDHEQQQHNVQLGIDIAHVAYRPDIDNFSFMAFGARKRILTQQKNPPRPHATKNLR